nr:phosphopantetheine-binding protein [Pseudomonas sp. ERMR1:02]
MLSVELEIDRQVICVLAATLFVGRRQVEVESRLVEDLYMDSISMVEVVMALNEMFGIELSESGVEEWKTVKDICILVREMSLMR